MSRKQSPQRGTQSRESANSPRGRGSKQRRSIMRSKMNDDEPEEDLITNETEDFIPKTEKEVIKVPNCTYCNDSISSKYYLCICSTSPKGFEPICEACARNCHGKHNPTLEVPGANICHCGLNNHIITKEMKEMFNKKQREDEGPESHCIYSKFFKIIPNKGYYEYNNKIYCSVCVQYCLRLDFDEPTLKFLDNDKTQQYFCSCKISHEMNIIKLNADFISKKDFIHHLRELNFNIIFKIPKSKEIYIDTLTQELKNYLVRKNSDTNFEFFRDILVNKILELFSMFSVFWENKYWFILPSLFGQFRIGDLFGLFSLGELIGKLKEDMVSNFISAKFYFAELMFNFVLRTYMLKYCNLWNINAILNMDLYQRLIYIHNLKIFHYFSNQPMKDNYLDDLVNNVLDLYDNILKVNERFPSIFGKIMSYVFPTFNRIIKYCMKYDIMRDESKRRYFNLVYETLLIQKERKLGTLKDSCFYILKSALYSLVYENDFICYDYLQDKDLYDKKGFMFCINEESSLITKILLLIMGGFDRRENPSKSIKFDYFVRKIFELLLNKEDFYLNSIYNLDRFELEFISNYPLINLSSLPLNSPIIINTIEKVKRNKDKKYSEVINNFCFELNKINRSYFEFGIEQNKYFDIANHILKKFNSFIEAEEFDLNEITVNFCCYQVPQNNYITKLNKLKNCIFYSTFFQRIDEFLHIYTASKSFVYEKEQTGYDQNLLFQNVDRLLKFIFVIIIRDHKFLTLIMSIKPEIFATTFNDVFDTLEEFLERVIEMLYSPSIMSSTGSHLGTTYSQDINKSSRAHNSSISGEYLSGASYSASDEEHNEQKQYKYDNYLFLSEVICNLIKINKYNLTTLSNLMRISTKLVKIISIKNSEYLDIGESFVETFMKIKNNTQIMDKIKNYFDVLKNNDNDNINIVNMEEMNLFIYSYYDFLCELYNSDIYFYDYLKDSEFLSLSQFEELFYSLLDNKFQNCPVQVEYSLCRYYLTIKNPLNFNTKEIRNQLKNLYMEGIEENINILHLSRKLLEDRGIPKTIEILIIIRKLCEILELFDTNRLKSYKNSKDFRFMYKYFENIILRPLFTYFNIFIIDINKVQGKDVFVFWRAVFNFIKICVEFYKCPKHETKLKVSEKKVLGFEEYIIKHELPKALLEDIYNEAKLFSDNNILYFQIEKIYRAFIRVINRIIKHNRVEESCISNTSYISENDIMDKIAGLNPYLAKKEKLIDIYAKLKQKTYDDNLSLIQSYKNIKEEIEYDAAIPIINYLIIKLFDPLTDSNLKRLSSELYQEKLKENCNSIQNYNYQNSYILIYLNSFFYNDSEDFQNAFSSSNIFKPNNFYEFFIENIIVANILNELKKINELDYLEADQPEPRKIGRFESLSFSTGRYAIKFIQNLCEGHNKEYQDLFFNYELDINEYLKNNKNIYEGISNVKSGVYQNLLLLTAGNKEALSKSNDSESKDSIDGNENVNKNVQEGNTINVSSRNATKSILMKKKSEDKFFQKLSKNSTTKLSSSMDSEIEDLEAEERERLLTNLKVSFFNLICHLMKIINRNIHIGNSLDSKLFGNIIKYKNYENINELYTRLSDLIVEMIQGTDPNNFTKFYQSNLPPDFTYFTEGGLFVSNQNHKIFVFLDLANQIKEILFNKSLAFDNLSYSMKFYLFTTINNLLTQEKVDESIVRAFTSIFPPEKLLELISLYLRGIYLSHYCRLTYSYEEFNKELSFLELNNSHLSELKRFFKENPHIFHDDYFQLASQMFLFLTVLAEKYNVNEAVKIKSYLNKKTTESKIIGFLDIHNPLTEEVSKFTSIFSVGNQNIKLKRVKPNEHNYLNDKIITAQFFSKIIKKCEFRIDNGENLELKIIYFICDPHYYYISKNNKENFFKDVDRSSATVKLKSLLEELDAFNSEIEYKKEIYRKSKYILFFLGLNYKMVDFCNFCISLIINIILLLFLKKESGDSFIINVIRIFVSLQIIMNLIFLYIFYISKYGFYVLLSKNKLGKDHKLTLMEKINLYILDSFLFNDEVYLLILIIIMGVCGVMTKYGAFFFALQLLSIIKFVDTIKEILLAFKIRFTQLLAILGFLAILIYFYANIGFYFLIDEFNLPNNSNENFCQTLFECTINYFNHGVRAGGGIGDLLEEKSYDEEKVLYLIRFFNDLIFYITVILLLLNMINGVIVTTFSQIREESNKKEEDQQNRCYICNIDRIEFQKNKIDFGEHQKYEHNINNYIKFFIYLSHIDEKDMDADQSFINECIKEKDIKFFPVNCAKSIGEVEPEEGEGD